MYAHGSQCATLGGPLLERGSGLMTAHPDDTERAIRACSNTSASALIPRPAVNSRITAPMPFAGGLLDGPGPINGTISGPSTITNLDQNGGEDGSENSSVCIIDEGDLAA